MMKLHTERDVVESLAGCSITMAELYQACVDAGVDLRADGHAPIPGFGSDCRYKRRARNAIQSLRSKGLAERVDKSTWVIAGTRAEPRRALLVVCGEFGRLELRLADAAQLLEDLGETCDLIVADPPWALGRQVTGDCMRDRGERVYRRDSSKVIPGYVDVPEDEYIEFTARWIKRAAAALRPGGHLSVITGPSAAARVQVAAEDAGLTFINQVVAPRPFALANAAAATLVALAQRIDEPDVRAVFGEE